MALSDEEKRIRRNEASRRWKEKNPEKTKAITKAWREANKERVKEYTAAASKKWRENNAEKHKEYNREWKRANKDKTRAYHLKSKFDITQDDYDRMLDDQGSACAICGTSYDKTYHVDHDHDTGEVRGLLCDCCNRGLGYFKDNPSIMASAITYLSKETNT